MWLHDHLVTSYCRFFICQDLFVGSSDEGFVFFAELHP